MRICFLLSSGKHVMGFTHGSADVAVTELNLSTRGTPSGLKSIMRYVKPRFFCTMVDLCLLESRA